MSDAKKYWIGKGSPFINSKPWPVKKPLPLGSLSEKWIKKMESAGNIGEKVKAGGKDEDDYTKLLEDTVNDLQAENKKLKDENQILKESVDDLQAENKKLKDENQILKESVDENQILKESQSKPKSKSTGDKK